MFSHFGGMPAFFSKRVEDILLADGDEERTPVDVQSVGLDPKHFVELKRRAEEQSEFDERTKLAATYLQEKEREEAYDLIFQKIKPSNERETLAHQRLMLGEMERQSTTISQLKDDFARLSQSIEARQNRQFSAKIGMLLGTILGVVLLWVMPPIALTGIAIVGFAVGIELLSTTMGFGLGWGICALVQRFTNKTEPKEKARKPSVVTKPSSSNKALVSFGGTTVPVQPSVDKVKQPESKYDAPRTKPTDSQPPKKLTR